MRDAIQNLYAVERTPPRAMSRMDMLWQSGNFRRTTTAAVHAAVSNSQTYWTNLIKCEMRHAKCDMRPALNVPIIISQNYKK
ncbi:hypothetical protein M413DRAFT_32689 [Hebeloma cylindrosporum]|uniref:Uncharacterized protein n=1 Tax=Hebeloma cylindrosporum TaxID=76867 RepID=A0A0C3BSX3_HEBCY|nr:hypothetical protein M413DRAFT_32689 [Hebeloma cylindrosporum h7]